MKQRYSTFAAPALMTSKNLNCSIEELCQKHIDPKLVLRDVMSRQEYDISRVAFAVDWLAVNGHAIHFFMGGKEFCDWLVSCVSQLDGEKVEFLWNELVPTNFAAIFHFPSESHLPSFGVHLYRKGGCISGKTNKKLDYPVAVFSFSRSCTGPLRGNACASVFTNAPPSEFKDGFEYFPKLLIGLGMYASCFPEMVKDGPPDNLKHPSIHCCDKLKSRTIAMSPQIHQANGSPTPHFRRGHFRVLSSEKFTHKRFQTIFVSESFVNAAKSKTVLSP